jgi:hypothetical protein
MFSGEKFVFLLSPEENDFQTIPEKYSQIYDFQDKQNVENWMKLTH